MKNTLLVLIILFTGIVHSQNDEMNSFEDIYFGIPNKELQMRIDLIIDIYGYGDKTIKNNKKHKIERTYISKEDRKYKSFKHFITGLDIDNIRRLYAVADVYRLKSKNDVCEVFYDVERRLRNKYKWDEKYRTRKGECCGCEESKNTYIPKFLNKKKYEEFYTSSLVNENYIVHIDAYRSKSGQWYVRAFYFEKSFSVFYRKLYDI